MFVADDALPRGTFTALPCRSGLVVFGGLWRNGVDGRVLSIILVVNDIIGGDDPSSLLLPFPDLFAHGICVVDS